MNAQEICVSIYKGTTEGGLEKKVKAKRNNQCQGYYRYTTVSVVLLFFISTPKERKKEAVFPVVILIWFFILPLRPYISNEWQRRLLYTHQ
jgi:hypothetical protein